MEFFYFDPKHVYGEFKGANVNFLFEGRYIQTIVWLLKQTHIYIHILTPRYLMLLYHHVSMLELVTRNHSQFNKEKKIAIIVCDIKTTNSKPSQWNFQYKN